MTTSVLLCADRAPSFEPRDGLTGFDDAVVRFVPGLCRKPREISQLATGATELVVGVCPQEHSLGAIQTQARTLGLDALGIELIDLSGVGDDPHRLSLITSGAIARARAFTGSRPEHSKITFPPRVSRRSLFSFAEHAYVAAPDVERKLCAAGVGCHACVDACPRGALTWSKGTIAHDTSVCEPCGLCMTACPTGAMVNPAMTPHQLEAQVRALLDQSVGPAGPRGLVFSCTRAARPETDPDWYPIGVPCTGMVSPAWLLAPLLMGAAATAARPCGDGGCPLGNGDHLAQVITFSHAYLDELGLPRELVRTRTDGPPGIPTLTEALEDPLDGPLEHPFGPLAANVLLSLAGAAGGSPHLTLDHPASPVGTITLGTDTCTLCTMCAQSCPTGALAWKTVDDGVSLSFDAALCTACAQCLPRCPELAGSAIRLSRVTDLEAISRGRQTVLRDDVSRCITCGQAIASSRLLGRLRRMAGEDGAKAMQIASRYCVDCRGLVMPTSTD